MASGKTYVRGLKSAEESITPAEFIAGGYAERIKRKECGVWLVYDVVDVRPHPKAAGWYLLVGISGDTRPVAANQLLSVGATPKPFVRNIGSPFSKTAAPAPQPEQKPLAPFTTDRVLPTLADLQRRQMRTVSSVLIGDLLGISRRSAYEHLRQLEQAVLATRRCANGRYWGVANLPHQP